jgi:pilus assembly protein Flp/PilA
MNIINIILCALKIDNRGVTAIEYAMIAALVAVAAATAMTALGTSLTATLAAIGAAL